MLLRNGRPLLLVILLIGQPALAGPPSSPAPSSPSSPAPAAPTPPAKVQLKLSPPPPPPPPPPAPDKKRDLLLTDPRLLPADALRTTHPGDWGLVQRSIDSNFRPARSLITDEGRTQTAVRQLGNGPAPADTPPGRQLPPDDNVELQESVEAAQRAYERPVSSRWAEVTAVTGADGRLISVTLTMISGNPRFDEAALAAVRKGLTARPPVEERRAMQSRWRVRGAVAVILPRAVAPMVPRVSNGRVPVRATPFPTPFATTFDESSGRARVQPAGSDKIETEIKLLSLQPVAE